MRDLIGVIFSFSFTNVNVHQIMLGLSREETRDFIFLYTANSLCIMIPPKRHLYVVYIFFYIPKLSFECASRIIVNKVLRNDVSLCLAENESDSTDEIERAWLFSRYGTWPSAFGIFSFFFFI